MVMLWVVARIGGSKQLNEQRADRREQRWPNARASVISSRYGAMKGFNKNKGRGKDGVN
jgi:hypothetical protein